MERGWVKLWRKILDNGMLQDGPAWQVFGWLLLNASRENTVTRAKTIGPGQVFVSLEELATACDLTKSKTWRAVNRLRARKVIETCKVRVAQSHLWLITLCNWGTYQNQESPGETPESSLRNVDETCAQSNFAKSSTQPLGPQQVVGVSHPDAQEERIKKKRSPLNPPRGTFLEGQENGSAEDSRERTKLENAWNLFVAAYRDISEEYLAASKNQFLEIAATRDDRGWGLADAARAYERAMRRDRKLPAVSARTWLRKGQFSTDWESHEPELDPREQKLIDWRQWQSRFFQQKKREGWSNDKIRAALRRTAAKHKIPLEEVM